ncbi:hypothetical protein P7K49_038001, partial [Saguinus oedipus]
GPRHHALRKPGDPRPLHITLHCTNAHVNRGVDEPPLRLTSLSPCPAAEGGRRSPETW